MERVIERSFLRGLKSRNELKVREQAMESALSSAPLRSFECAVLDLVRILGGSC